MIQLSYQPAYDPFHSAFRLVRIFLADTDLKWSFDQIRIVDFYVAFPDLIERIQGLRTKARKYQLVNLPKPYSERPNPQTIFNQMWPIQQAALQTICIKGLVVFDDDPMTSELSIDLQKVPEQLFERANNRNSDDSNLMRFVVSELHSLPVNGVNGLKHRSGLLEYRYDIV